MEALLRHTRAQILACARVLGLTGLHALRKEALVERFYGALSALATSLGIAPPVSAPASADAAHKFDLGRTNADSDVRPQHIPWGYGQDRVTAMVVDPDRLYVYWEVTDEAIARARADLGPGGNDAWLNLRVYDVSGRLFDGTNAHSYLDHAVARTDRQWFFHIGKPTSTACVEIGLKSHEGYFVRTARSGRADFPRRDPAPEGVVEWLTVRASTGEVDVPFSTTAYAGSHEPSPPPEEVVRLWDIRQLHAGGPGGLPWHEVVRPRWLNGGTVTVEWVGPLVRTTWEAGPFPFPIAAPSYVEERFEGAAEVFVENGATRVVYGPWQVVIRGLGARAERRIVATWEISRSWTVRADVGARSTPSDFALGGSERVMLGASEWVRLAASELRLGGASEVYFAGASELRYLGASEILYGSASELRYRGASEALYGAGSEVRLHGASELLVGGASERARRR